MELFSLKLNREEDVLVIIRRHFSTFKKSFIQFLIISAVIGSFYFFIPQNSWKLIAVAVLEAVALIFLIYKLLIWYMVSIIITTERIIDVDQNSLTKRVITEVLLNDIAQVLAYREGIFQKIFNVGNLVIEVKEGGKIVGLCVKNPVELTNKINRLRKANEQTKNSLEPQGERQ